jgi:hypothetical protein
MDATQDQLTKWSWDAYYVPHTSNKLMFCNAFISLKNISQGRIETQQFYESFTVHETPFLHVYIPYKLLH